MTTRARPKIEETKTKKIDKNTTSVPPRDIVRMKSTTIMSQREHTQMISSWSFGRYFLEDFGFRAKLVGSGQLELSRWTARHKVVVTIPTQNDNRNINNNRKKTDIITTKIIEGLRKNSNNNNNNDNEEDDETEYLPRFPFSVRVSLVNGEGDTLSRLHVTCNGRPKNKLIIQSIMVEHMGEGTHTHPTTHKIADFSPQLREKILDYLDELCINSLLVKFVRGYSEKLSNWEFQNIPF
jgi:hypothetical protein